ncbi:MAG: PKD domain-containing protein, partial [Candidatus Thermoplasmatota archaeon]|nr:PKD domain-containing protein [Candidatus Thermoplasmatota archaeon]
ASNSWDLDDDRLTYTWTSSIDGDLLSSCFGTLPSGNNGSFIVANNPPETADGCLSDGEQEITLEVCDSGNQCVSESRTIELFNRPPSLSVSTSPSISSWGIMHLGRTANATISLEGSSDPEGDELTCWIETNYGFSTATDQGCPMIFDINFPGAPTQFTLTIYLSDGNNPDVTWSFNVNLFNEIPEPEFDVLRAGETSDNLVILDGSMVFDPEGDEVRFEFWSDLDGLLISGVTPDDEIEWRGWLTKGSHTITMYTSDDRPGHVSTWNSVTEQVSVNNSAPISVIAQPADQMLTESSEVVRFDATGSGDWDLACGDLPNNGSGFVCSPTAASSKDLVSIVWTSDRLLEPIGSGWVIDSRLPKGYHTVTLTIDDSSSNVATSSIVVRVEESAPVLILDSPIPEVEVYSNAPVLFDFRQSFDPDGDDFTVTVTSDLLAEPILQDKTNEYWYNDYLPAGEHRLTFELRDSTDRVRTHTQTLFVMQTGPVAIIDGLLDGQYIPPGSTITLDGSQSFDYDDDIVLYEWTTGDGQTIGTREIMEVEFTPGPIRIDLLVKDSRGASSTTSVNLTIGASSPILSQMMIVPNQIELDNPTPMKITVNLEDADGTTQSVTGVMKISGSELNLIFQDDGTRGDDVAGDGIWTYVGTWLIEEEGWVNVEVWAIDGEFTSPALIETISVEEPQTTSFVSWIAGSGLPYLVVVVVALILLGMVYQKNRNEAIRRD